MLIFDCFFQNVEHFNVSLSVVNKMKMYPGIKVKEMLMLALVSFGALNYKPYDC